MKKFKDFIVSFALFVGITYVVLNSPVLFHTFNEFIQSPCNTAVSYRIDRIDPQFNLTKEQFQNDVQKAAQTWNQAAGKTVLEYKTDGTLSVNLIYDERQSYLNQIDSLDQSITSQKSSLDNEIQTYKALKSDFNERVASYNAKVTFWNNKGGAPQNQYQALKQEAEELNTIAQKLNTLAQKLNQETDQYNVSVDTLNQAVKDYNQNLQEKPEGGIYLGSENKINVYLYHDQNELQHTIIHELGHSLGIGHVTSNQNAVMYPVTNENIVLTVEDENALLTACRSPLQTIINRILKR